MARMKPLKTFGRQAAKNAHNRANLRTDTISRTTLGKAIQKLAKRRGLTRDEMGKLCDDAPSQMSRLMHDHFGEFSIDRLADFYTRLGGKIYISLVSGMTKPNSNPHRKWPRGKVRFDQYE